MAQYEKIFQGNLNRIKASVVFNTNDTLSVHAANLGPEGIRLAFDGNATELLPTMTGVVGSPHPYMPCTLTIAIVRTMPVADLYVTTIALGNTLVGDVQVFPDVNPTADYNTQLLRPFQLENMALETVREMAFNGSEAVIVVTLRGLWRVNQGFFA